MFSATRYIKVLVAEINSMQTFTSITAWWLIHFLDHATELRTET